MKRKRLRTWVKVVILFIVLCMAGGIVFPLINILTKKPKDEPVVEVVEEEIEEVEEVKEPEVYTAKLFVTGDMLVHGTVWMDADQHDGTYDFSPHVENIGRLSEGYDLKFYNQETILGGTELGLHGYPTFNSPQEAGKAMVDLGFNLVSTSTNHTLDYGVQGVTNSYNFWHAQDNVVMEGSYLDFDTQKEIRVHEINGITYTFLSWTYGCNGLLPPSGMEYLVNIYTGHEDELLEQIRQANEISDVVIVAMHWGTEYSMGVNDEQYRLAREMVDAGADIIIGNHPHVIEPAEWIGDSFCFYAMGNMLSAQIDEPNLIGMVGGLTITKTVDGDNVDVKLSDACLDLTFNYYDVGYKNFKVIPFCEIDDAHLPNHEAMYQKYLDVALSLDDSIKVGVWLD